MKAARGDGFRKVAYNVYPSAGSTLSATYQLAPTAARAAAKSEVKLKGGEPK